MGARREANSPWIPSVEIAEPQSIKLQAEVIVDNHKLFAFTVKENESVVKASLVLDETPEQRAVEERRITADHGLEKFSHGAAVTPVQMRRFNVERFVVRHGQSPPQDKGMGVGSAGGADGVVAQVNKERQLCGLVQSAGLLQNSSVLAGMLQGSHLAGIRPGQADAMGIALAGAIKRCLKGL